MKEYIKKIVIVIFGLFLCAIGMYLSMQANIGLAPWDAFSVGLSNLLNTTYGNASVITGLVIIFIDLLLKEKIGIGSILNAILIGKFVDLLYFIDILPKSNNFILSIIMMYIGQLFLCVATYVYMSPGLGCGPRDSLMVGLGKLFSNIPIGVVRGILEAFVVFTGYMLGAKIGIGTILYVVMIGFNLELVFNFFNFNSEEVVHESLFESFNKMKTKTY